MKYLEVGSGIWEDNERNTAVICCNKNKSTECGVFVDSTDGVVVYILYTEDGNHIHFDSRQIYCKPSGTEEWSLFADANKGGYANYVYDIIRIKGGAGFDYRVIWNNMSTDFSIKPFKVNTKDAGLHTEKLPDGSVSLSDDNLGDTLKKLAIPVGIGLAALLSSSGSSPGSPSPTINDGGGVKVSDFRPNYIKQCHGCKK